MTFFLGVDLGSTKTAVSVWNAPEGDEAPSRIGTRRWPTPQEGPEVAIERMIEQGKALLGEVGVGRELAGVGISGGGPVDPAAGVVLWLLV